MEDTNKTRMTLEEMPAALTIVLEDLKQIKSQLSKISVIDSNAIKSQHTPIGIERVSELTGKAVTTLYRYTANGLIPCYKRGKTMLFYEDEIVDWVRSGKCESIEERAASYGGYIVPMQFRRR
jgi:predicted DNA-binding transcriptional regulator AlpA